MNNFKTILKVIAFLVIFFLLFYFVKLFFSGEAGKIRRLVFSTKRAIEKEDLLKCIQTVSFAYSDDYGNDRSTLLAAAKEVFYNWDSIQICVKDLKLELDNQHAKVKILASSTAKRIREEGKIDFQALNFVVYFNKEKDSWKVIRLEFLEPKDISGFIS